MAKKVKQAININDILMTGAFNEREKIEIVGDDLWPIAVAVYAASEGKVRIAKCHRGPASSTMFITNTFGMQVCVVQRCSDQYSVQFSSHPVMKHEIKPETVNLYSMNTTIQSINPRYVVNMLRKNSSHDVKRYLSNEIKDADFYIHDVVRSICDRVVDAHAGRGINKPTIDTTDNHLMTAALDCFMRGASLMELPETTRSKLTARHNVYTKQYEEFVKAIAGGKDFFHSDKLVLITMDDMGFVVGSIKGMNPQIAIERYLRYGEIPARHEFNYVQEADIPFQWFKSYNDVPDELKARIEASTIMLKTHTNCAGMLPEDEPNKVWLNIDAASYRQSYNHWTAATFMVNL